MNDDNDGVVKCQKNSTTPPRCHSDQVDPLVLFDACLEPLAEPGKVDSLPDDFLRDVIHDDAMEFSGEVIP